MDDGLGDWRHWAATRITNDIPAAFAGGPSHVAGSAVHVSTMTRDQFGRLTGFVMPSPAALALGASIDAAHAADRLRGKLAFVRQISPFGDSRGVPLEGCADLYDFFERSMIAVILAFNSIEIFCNHEIAQKLETQRYERRVGSKTKLLTSAQLQRQATTEEKAFVALPAILGIASPRSSPLWSRFERLRSVRNRTIHLKSQDAYKDNIDEQSLFHEFFFVRTVATFPLDALDLISALKRTQDIEHRWLAGARKKLGIS